MSQEAEISAETSILAKASIATSSLGLGAATPRFWVPRKMGQKKKTFPCPSEVKYRVRFARRRFRALEHDLSSLATPQNGGLRRRRGG